MQQVVAGLASGSIYASLALALVLIHRATGVINFAQGEMATLSTYVAWALITNHGWSYWLAFAATLVISFVGGAVVHQAIIRPNDKGSVLRVVIVTIGLLLFINGLIILIWGGEIRAMESPFPTRTIEIAGVAISIQDIGTIGVVLATVVALWLLFQYTKLGLAPLITREIFRIVTELNEKEGLTVLVVEQDARIALDAASQAYVLEVGRVAVAGSSAELERNESVRRSYLGY